MLSFALFPPRARLELSDVNIKLFSPRASAGASSGDLGTDRSSGVGVGGGRDAVTGIAASGGGASSGESASGAAAANSSSGSAADDVLSPREPPSMQAVVAGLSKPKLRRVHSFGAMADLESLHLSTDDPSTASNEHGAGASGRRRAGSRAAHQSSEKAFERWYFEYMDRLLDVVIERRARRRQKQQMAEAADGVERGGRGRSVSTRT